MKKELKKMKNENKLIVKADKSNKYYKMDVEDYWRHEIETIRCTCSEEDRSEYDI